MLHTESAASPPSSPLTSTAYAAELAMLTAIYEPRVNVVVHRRDPDPELVAYVRGHLVSRDWTRTLEVRSRLQGAYLSLPEGVPEHRSFTDDVAFLVEIYAELFGAERVGLRLCAATSPMCPRFHVDKVGVRMVCTYEGPGTEWVDHGAAPRDGAGRLLRDPGATPIAGSPIHRMRAFDLGLLKGEAWPDNRGRGAVHRSPAHTGGRRLFVSLEAI